MMNWESLADGYRRKLYIVSAGNITNGAYAFFTYPKGWIQTPAIVGVFYSNVLKMSAHRVSTELKSLTND